MILFERDSNSVYRSWLSYSYYFVKFSRSPGNLAYVNQAWVKPLLLRFLLELQLSLQELNVQYEVPQLPHVLIYFVLLFGPLAIQIIVCVADLGVHNKHARIQIFYATF